MITHPAIRLIVNDLSAARGARLIFQGVSLEIGAGEALTLVGPNGVGKTTLLRTLAGFIPAAAGSAQLVGGDAEKSLGEQSHYIGHLNGIKPSLSVLENLIFFTEFLGGTEAMAVAAGDRFGLGALEDVPAAYLSAGQKRRLGLARLVCAARPVWLLDEPAVSLDAASQALLGGMVSEHLAGGGIVFAATHMPLGWVESRSFDLGLMAAAAPADA